MNINVQELLISILKFDPNLNFEKLNVVFEGEQFLFTINVSTRKNALLIWDASLINVYNFFFLIIDIKINL